LKILSNLNNTDKKKSIQKYPLRNRKNRPITAKNMDENPSKAWKQKIACTIELPM